MNVIGPQSPFDPKGIRIFKRFLKYVEDNYIEDVEKIFEEISIKRLIKDKRKSMSEAVEALDFETAAIVRDEIRELEGRL